MANYTKSMKQKTIIILLVLILTAACTNRPKVHFLVNDYQEVIKSAALDNKNIFIDFYTVWCGGCKGYDKFVFTDSVFQEYLKSNFYSLKINAELIENKLIVNRYSIKAYPTIIVADKNGNEIDRIAGYKYEYGDNSQVFINKIEGILRGEETLKILTEKYYKNPDSILLLRHIIREEFINKGDYVNLKKFTEDVSLKAQKKSIKDELIYWAGYADIKNKIQPNPTSLIDLTKDPTLIDSIYVAWSYSNLLNYYIKINHIDSIDYYFKKLLDFPPKRNFYYIRKYARFLFENGRDIDLAIELTQEYKSLPGAEGDHWTPYLMAHCYAYQNQLNKGIQIFDDWMEEYVLSKNIKDEFWPYDFYVDFALFYNVNPDKALEYAYILEDMLPSPFYKKQLAKLLYLHNEKGQAIIKLREIIPLIEDANEKEEIDNLIERYKT